MRNDVRRLMVIAFMCGAALMALEMTGVRVLNVYFGTTHYVWGAIIGLFLGALAAGYFLGGIVADRRPHFHVLGVIIAASGAFHFLIPLMAKPLCEALAGSGWDTRWQALLGSIILYGIPSILLGMVSPFVVRLAANSVEDMGRVAGRLYAVSTAGSLAGTFAVSFILIEYFGNITLIIGIGMMLMLTAALTLRTRIAATATALMGMMLAGGMWLFVNTGMTVPAHFRHATLLEEFDSPYHHVIVLESDNYTTATLGADGKPQRARYLLFNSLTQSGIAIGGAEDAQRIRPATEYVQRLNIGQLFQKKAPESMCVIGCGGGVGPMMFRQAFPELKHMDVVDIDPTVFDMARKHFGYVDNDGVITSHVCDGRLFLRRTTKRYDVIILDAYSAGGRIPWHLITREFLQTTRERLTEHGVVVMNVISAKEGKFARLLHAVDKTANEVFGGVYLFPRHERSAWMRPETADNIFIVCTPEDQGVSGEDILALYRSSLGSTLRLEGLEESVLAQIHLPAYMPDTPTLTDDYAPTDSMTFR